MRAPCPSWVINGRNPSGRSRLFLEQRRTWPRPLFATSPQPDFAPTLIYELNMIYTTQAPSFGKRIYTSYEKNGGPDWEKFEPLLRCYGGLECGNIDRYF